MPNKSKQPLTIRLCGEDNLNDFWEIDRLERECAQGTLLRFHFAPDDPRNPRPRAHKYHNSLITLAENADGKIVGTVSGHVRTVRVAEGRYEKIGWIFSLRVGLDQRRTGVATNLIKDMEERLTSQGAKFVFESVALDNIPSVHLFEKYGYNYMWKARFYGINLSNANKSIDKLPAEKLVAASGVNRLDTKQSKAFLRKHFAKSFMYPENDDDVVDSNVYVACQGENLVAINLWAESDKLGIVAIPFYLRILYYVMILLSFLFPHFFEKPLPLARPWQMRWAYPILVDCNARDRNVSRDLFNAALTQIVRDLKTNGGDVLNIPCERGISGLHESHYNLVRKMPYVSPLMRGTGGIIEIARGLTPPGTASSAEAAEIVSAAAKQPFWFLNNSI